MKKVAIYARYSTELQNARSIDDQIRECCQRATLEGWEVYECYADRATSGANIMRAGLQRMLQDARQGKFDAILVESLDRLSRDPADIAAIFKHMQFEGIPIFTLIEGRVGIIDIGLRGTMNQLYLVEISKKVRRGQHGRIKAGKVANGLCYGYEVVREFDDHGQPVRGERRINERQAKLIRWIFREYGIVGSSPVQIAHTLNGAGVPSPTGYRWGPSTIGGNPRRGIGILNNEFYIGQLVWNRMSYIVNPANGKRVYRINPENEWVRETVPELRIVDQALWDRAKDQQRKRHSAAAIAALHVARVRHGKPYPIHLLSGLLTCGSCGSGFAIRHDDYGCSARHNKGTCDNQLRIKRQVLEDKVLTVLKARFASDPERCAAFCEAYALRLKDRRIERKESVQALKYELSRLETARDGISRELARSPDEPDLLAELGRAAELQALVKRALARTLDAIEVDRALENHFPEYVEMLVDTLRSHHQHKDSYETFRSLIGEIVLTPNDKGAELVVDVLGSVMKHRRRRKTVRNNPNSMESHHGSFESR